jgi:integrase
VHWSCDSRARHRNRPRWARRSSVSITHVFTTLKGEPYTYDTAWTRARDRAKIKNVHFHDLRAKALTDVDDEHDIKAAQGMGGHSTQSQTADYIRHKKARKVSATPLKNCLRRKTPHWGNTPKITGSA